MVLTDLSRKLTAAISKLNTRAGGTVDEEAVKGVIRDIQRALIDSDVNTTLVAAVSPQEHVLHVVDRPGAEPMTMSQLLNCLFWRCSWARTSRARPSRHWRTRKHPLRPLLALWRRPWASRWFRCL